jgi:hypothetical protein
VLEYIVESGLEHYLKKAIVLYEFVKPTHNLLYIHPSTIVSARCEDLCYGPPIHKLCWQTNPTFETLEKI